MHQVAAGPQFLHGRSFLNRSGRGVHGRMDALRQLGPGTIGDEP